MPTSTPLQSEGETGSPEQPGSIVFELLKPVLVSERSCDISKTSVPWTQTIERTLTSEMVSGSSSRAGWEANRSMAASTSTPKRRQAKVCRRLKTSCSSCDNVEVLRISSAKDSNCESRPCSSKASARSNNIARQESALFWSNDGVFRDGPQLEQTIDQTVSPIYRIFRRMS